VIAPLQDGRTWTWDVAHNPDPLSLAQQGLVERVEGAGLAPWSLRVCGGFLYSASRGDPPMKRPTLTELQTRGVELEATLEKTLKVDGTPTIAEAIERYLAFYAVWARELSPLIAAARAALPEQLRAFDHVNPEAVAASMIGTRESAAEATLFAAARGELDESDVVRHLGCLAPAWDVSVPTYAERPGVLRDAIARATRALAARSTARHVDEVREARIKSIASELADELALARCAADLGERDDVLFARAQLLVRKAILARAVSLGIAPEDAFWLPLDELASAASIDPLDARRKASGARAAAERAALWQMPLVVGGEPPHEHPPLRGSGTGPRVAGRVVRFASLASAVAVGAQDVVVARANTPALSVLVAGCAALVSETGGLLDHGAALAREMGIPCVVGCRDAWTSLSDGMLVTVDGDGGTVTPTL
jgi:pyruvate,water dikinase